MCKNIFTFPPSHAPRHPSLPFLSFYSPSLSFFFEIKKKQLERTNRISSE